MTYKHILYKLSVKNLSSKYKNHQFDFRQIEGLLNQYNENDKKTLNLFLVNVTEQNITLLLVLDKNRTVFLDTRDFPDFDKLVGKSDIGHLSESHDDFFVTNYAAEVHLPDIIHNNDHLKSALTKAGFLTDYHVDYKHCISLTLEQRVHILNYLETCLTHSNTNKKTQIEKDLKDIEKILCKYIY